MNKCKLINTMNKLRFKRLKEVPKLEIFLGTKRILQHIKYTTSRLCQRQQIMFVDSKQVDSTHKQIGNYSKLLEKKITLLRLMSRK